MPSCVKVSSTLPSQSSSLPLQLSPAGSGVQPSTVEASAEPVVLPSGVSLPPEAHAATSTSEVSQNRDEALIERRTLARRFEIPFRILNRDGHLDVCRSLARSAPRFGAFNPRAVATRIFG